MRSLSITLLVVAGSLAAIGADAAAVKVALGNGAEVRGEVISDKPDRVVLDLGFSLLSIPRNAIASVQPLADAAPKTATFNSDLYREGGTEGESNVRTLAEKVGPAVVQVNSPTGLGSGFIIHPDGYVITNNHVIAGENTLSVTVFQGAGKSMQKRRYDKIRIVATSVHLDLALLKIEGASGNFATVPLGDSEEVRQGMQVFAVGSPMGLERSVSAGIISLRNRDAGTRLLVQTTAQINPGNSGGPLFNLRGEVIGVNDLKIVGFGMEGLGFSIPVDTLKDFLRNRDAYAFDTANPNAGFRYYAPPAASVAPKPAAKKAKPHTAANAPAKADTPAK